MFLGAHCVSKQSQAVKRFNIRQHAFLCTALCASPKYKLESFSSTVAHQPKKSGPKEWWDTPQQFADWLADALDITHWEQWYNVSVSQISRKGGASLLRKYNGSPPLMIMALHPNYPWKM